MEYIALGAGVLIGLVHFLTTKAVDWILIVLHYIPFKSQDSFYALYDNTEDEEAYERLKHLKLTNVNSYADYLRLHQEARPSAHERFRAYYGTLAKLLMVRVAPITLLPAVIFWSHWYYYVFGLLFVLAILVAYALIVKPSGAGARKRLMVFAVMRDYLNDSKRTK